MHTYYLLPNPCSLLFCPLFLISRQYFHKCSPYNNPGPPCHHLSACARMNACGHSTICRNSASFIDPLSRRLFDDELPAVAAAAVPAPLAPSPELAVQPSPVEHPAMHNHDALPLGTQDEPLLTTQSDGVEVLIGKLTIHDENNSTGPSASWSPSVLAFIISLLPLGELQSSSCLTLCSSRLPGSCSYHFHKEYF